MIDVTTLVIYIFAVYRITRFMVQDHLFEPIRNHVWKKFPPESTKIGYLFTCPWCLSTWIATIFATGYILIPSVMFYVALILALSATTGIISKLLDRD